MDTTRRDAALICAALEVLPAAPRDLSYLLEEARTVENLLQVDLGSNSRSGALRRYIVETLDLNRLDYWAGRLELLEREAPDLRYVSVIDSAYPATVRRAFDRPPILFWRGNLPAGRATAVVGSRQASPEASFFAADAARELVAAGHTVVSGLARGIDGLAHDACIRAGGRTVAILGHALDVPMYPPEHDELASRVLGLGALVSQFKPGAPTTASSFVQRNSLISAFAEVSLVVTANERSGSRSELEAALAQDREVVLPSFAVAQNRWMRSLASRERRVHVASSPAEAAEIATNAPNAPASRARTDE